jgi:hypothetical protein
LEILLFLFCNHELWSVHTVNTIQNDPTKLRAIEENDEEEEPEEE